MAKVRWVAAVVAALAACAGSQGGGGPPDAGTGTNTEQGDGGVPDAGTVNDGGTVGDTSTPPPPDAGTAQPPAVVVLKAPTTIDGWAFYGTEQGLPAEVYDVSADEGGNVYVAGGDGVYAKAPAAAVAPASDTFKRFDAAAGLTQNCFQGLDPFTATEADLDRTVHPNPPGAPAMCPIVSVAGAAAGKAIVGFYAYGTDGDLNGEWAKDSGGLDVLSFDATAGKLARTRHVHVATPPGVICGSFENTTGANPVCQPWDEFMLYGRRKLHKVFRIAVNHHQGTPQYGDVWMGGTHATLSAFFNDQAEARGWYGNAWIRNCTTAAGADPKVCPKFQDPVTGSWNVFEHEHPAFNATPFPNEPGVVKGPDKTGETWALAIAPSGQPWAHNGLRLAAMHGDTANLGAGVNMDWNLVFDLWHDDPKADPLQPQPADDDVQSMTFCPDGALWVGSRTHGLARVGTADGSVAGYGLPGGGQNVWALACDRNNNLWISTDWAEIVRYDTHAGTWSMPLATKAGIPELARHVAWNIQIDDWSQPNPVVYFALRSQGGKPGGVVAYAGK